MVLLFVRNKRYQLIQFGLFSKNNQLALFIVNNKLFVGSLPWGVDDAQLSELFSAHGSVVSARVITDRDTGRSRGFGFVEYADEAGATAAMEALDGTMIEGRTISVSFARPKAE